LYDPVADEVIATLRNGYERILGKVPRGRGGVERSLGAEVARAPFLRTAPIIVLEEPTSA
jgi:hypothetical protein